MQTECFYHYWADMWSFYQTAVNVSKNSQFSIYLIMNQNRYALAITDWEVLTAPFPCPQFPRLIPGLGEQVPQLRVWKLQQGLKHGSVSPPLIPDNQPNFPPPLPPQSFCILFPGRFLFSNTVPIISTIQNNHWGSTYIIVFNIFKMHFLFLSLTTSYSIQWLSQTGLLSNCAILLEILVVHSL